MTNIQTATREELEIAILDANIEDVVFNGIEAIIKTDTEEIREKLTQWVIENSEF